MVPAWLFLWGTLHCCVLMAQQALLEELNLSRDPMTMSSLRKPPLRESSGGDAYEKSEKDEVMDDMFKHLGIPEKGTVSIAGLPDPYIFSLRDTQQKVVCLQNNQLLAVPQASNIAPEEISVMPNRVINASDYPILMGVQAGKLCLSCGTSTNPGLKLEVQDIQKLYYAESRPFTFKSIKKGSTHHFESVANPGWFLCTSQNENQPLSITNRPGEDKICDFYFTKIR